MDNSNIISKILLLCIIFIIFILLINKCTNYLNKEFITNNLSNNSTVSISNDNLLIPTSDQTYNPYDVNRPGNNLSYQQTKLSINTADNVNTDIDIPLVYSKDEIEDTTIIQKYSPSHTRHIIDAGSGIIEQPKEINNVILNNFRSLE